MSDVSRADEGRTLLAVDLALKPAPALVQTDAPVVTAGVDLCGEQLQHFMQCILERQSDDFCQESLLLLAICKERRDAALRTRILQYDQTNGTDPAPLRREALETQQALQSEQKRQTRGETLGSVHLTARLRDLNERITALSKGAPEPYAPEEPPTSSP
jgi:hypothetical protein